MIGSVRGTVIERSPTGEVLVEVGGVGYRCLVPLGAIPALTPGAQGFLFTHLHVREDAMTLYGFPTRDERDTFEILIGASGVGPKLALAMLSVHSPGALRRCVADDDVDTLCVVPGVGKRTAQKLMVELKNRLGVPDVDLVDTGADGGPNPRAEVRAALTELGYSADEVRDALRELPDDGTVGDLLRAALKQLAVKT
jgi:Holliday junction DNA helicase RuvA